MFKSIISLVEAIAMVNLLLTVFLPDANLLVHKLFWSLFKFATVLQDNELTRELFTITLLATNMSVDHVMSYAPVVVKLFNKYIYRNRITASA
jgi:hypothetical protein